MKTLNRMMTNICSENFEQSKIFYTKLFDFNIDYDSDGFIHLISKDKQLELGIINRSNEIVPENACYLYIEKGEGYNLTQAGNITATPGTVILSTCGLTVGKIIAEQPKGSMDSIIVQFNR